MNREIRRGNRYDAVMLDPPSYGHGAHGEVWRLAEDLPGLLASCATLTAGHPVSRVGPRFVLLTCHTAGFSPAVLRELLAAHFGPADVYSAPLALVASTGERLPSGVVARFGYTTRG